MQCYWAWLHVLRAVTKGVTNLDRMRIHKNAFRTLFFQGFMRGSYIVWICKGKMGSLLGKIQL